MNKTELIAAVAEKTGMSKKGFPAPPRLSAENRRSAAGGG